MENSDYYYQKYKKYKMLYKKGGMSRFRRQPKSVGRQVGEPISGMDEGFGSYMTGRNRPIYKKIRKELISANNILNNQYEVLLNSLKTLTKLEGKVNTVSDDMPIITVLLNLRDDINQDLEQSANIQNTLLNEINIANIHHTHPETLQEQINHDFLVNIAQLMENCNKYQEAFSMAINTLRGLGKQSTNKKSRQLYTNLVKILEKFFTENEEFMKTDEKKIEKIKMELLGTVSYLNKNVR